MGLLDGTMDPEDRAHLRAVMEEEFRAIVRAWIDGLDAEG